MNSRDAIATTAAVSTMVLKGYIEDLSDEELMQRPHPECNHLKWQLGHLVASEQALLESICPGKGVALPDGFAEAHSPETANRNDPQEFESKQTYLELLDAVESASLAALGELSEEDLDQPSPEHFRNMFPTVGHIFVLIATHRMMHAGQFVPVRRNLGKPIKM